MSGQRNHYVLDTFAVAALVFDEPGAAQVRELLARARGGQADVSMSVVNWGEMLYTIERRSDADQAARAAVFLDSVPVQIVAVDKPFAQRAAHFKVVGRLSYADCYAAALAQIRDAAVVTGDPEFHSVENLVAIEWLPQRQA